MNLGDYLRENDLSPRAFAELVGVTDEAIRLYVANARLPRRDVMQKIAEATGGMVRPNDFFAEAS